MLAALPVALVYALLLQRKHFIKWVAWGSSAVSSALTTRPSSQPQAKQASSTHALTPPPSSTSTHMPSRQPRSLTDRPGSAQARMR
jgi:hypothetical protein